MMYRNASLPELNPGHAIMVMDTSMAVRKRRLAVLQLTENMRLKFPRLDNNNNDNSSCSSSIDTDESDCGSSDEETENMASRAFARANFSAAVPESEMNRVIERSSPEKMPGTSAASVASAFSALARQPTKNSLLNSRLTSSMPKISTAGLVQIHQQPQLNAIMSGPKPDSVLKSMLEQKGYEYTNFDALSLKDFFVEVTEDVVKAYEMDVIKAVRENDISTLRDFYMTGRRLQCANKFGDSIVHTACRRGSLEMVQFLLKEAKLSCKVCCDYGRTSLHDACWTSSPNFKVMDELFDACPDLLFTKDKRGFTPLDYARPGQYGEWCKYLMERGVDRLLPRELELPRLSKG